MVTPSPKVAALSGQDFSSSKRPRVSSRSLHEYNLSIYTSTVALHAIQSICVFYAYSSPFPTAASLFLITSPFMLLLLLKDGARLHPISVPLVFNGLAIFASTILALYGLRRTPPFQSVIMWHLIYRLRHPQASATNFIALFAGIILILLSSSTPSAQASVAQLFLAYGLDVSRRLVIRRWQSSAPVLASSFHFQSMLIVSVVFSPSHRSPSIDVVCDYFVLFILMILVPHYLSVVQSHNKKTHAYNSQRSPLVLAMSVSVVLALLLSTWKGYTVSWEESLAALVGIGSLALSSSPSSKVSSTINTELPIYDSQFSHPTKHRLWLIYKHIASDRNSRKIFQFLVLNFMFMFVEMFVGFYSNSMGLLSDAAHMLFDCVALAIGLYASYIAKWKSNDIYTYGYARFQVLAGLVNGIFLIFVSFEVFIESLERVFNPPEIETGQLLVVSVLGLLVNIVGIIFFHDVHSHGHGGDAPSCSAHGHSHGDDNMRGVFLHVIADAMGSVGVIISSLLIKFYGWHLSDPVCSILISGLILLSVYPLVMDTCRILLQRLPDELSHDAKKSFSRVLLIDGVLGYRSPHVWEIVGGRYVCSLHVLVGDEVDEQAVIASVRSIIKPLVSQVTIQVEKQKLVDTLSSSVRMSYHMTESTVIE